MSMKKTRRNVKSTIVYYLVLMVFCLGWCWWNTREGKFVILCTICGLLGFVVAMLVYREGKSSEEYVNLCFLITISCMIIATILTIWVDRIITIMIMAADIPFMATMRIRRDIENERNS